MTQIKEINLPNKITVSELREIIQKINEVNVLHLKNDLFNVKIVKIEEPITLYLVFGERYTSDDNDRGRWERVLNITDNLDELAWFIKGL
jgi:hypothetical protein